MQQHGHHQEGGQESGPPFREQRKQLGVILAIAQMVSAPAELWVRKAGTFGEKYLGYHLGMGLIIMLFAPLLIFPGEDCRPLLIAWVLTLVVLLAHRIKGAWMRKRGHVSHSQYSGDSMLSFLGEGIWIKQRLEPGLLIFAGIAVCFLSPPLGAWMIAPGVCLGLSVGWNSDRDAARVRAMKDARLEAAYYTDRASKEMNE